MIVTSASEDIMDKMHRWQVQNKRKQELMPVGDSRRWVIVRNNVIINEVYCELVEF